MKCVKYSQEWFDNQLLQILHNQETPKNRLLKLISLNALAKKHNIKRIRAIKTKSTINDNSKDFNKPKTKKSMNARKARLKRKRKNRRK